MLKNELAFKNHENGMKVARMLLQENYVVMISTEEDLLILNWEWSQSGCEYGGADRNDVVFMAKEDLYENYYEKADFEELEAEKEM